MKSNILGYCLKIKFKDMVYGLGLHSKEIVFGYCL